MSIPFLSFIPKEFRKQAYSYLAVISFVTVSLLPSLCRLLNIAYNYEFVVAIGGGYTLLVLLGYLLSHYEINKKQRICIYILGVSSLIIRIIGTFYYSYKNNQLVNIFSGYNNLTCVLYSISIFVFFKYSHFSNKLNKIFDYLSSYTFGIYLIHWYIIDYSLELFHFNVKSIIYRVIAPWIYILICCLIIYIIKKIPVVKHIIP